MKKAVRVVMAAAGLGILLAGCAKKEPAPETTGTTAETAEKTTAEETEEVSRDIFARLSEAPEDAEAQYVIVEDDDELRALIPLFEEELDDIGIDIEQE